MLALLISTGIDTLKMLAIVAIVALPLMTYRRTRRVTVAMVKLTIRKTPKSLRWLIVAAQFCPGQIDDVLVFAIVLIPILRNAHNRATFARTVRYAWSS